LFSSILGESEKGQEIMQKFNDAFQQVIQALIPVFDSLFTAIEPLIQPVVDVVIALGEGMAPILHAIIPALKALFEALTPIIQLFSAVLTPVIWVFAKAVEVIAKVIGGIAKTFINIINGIIGLINKIPGININKIGEGTAETIPTAQQTAVEDVATDRTEAATARQGRLKSSDAGAELVKLLAPLANFNSLLAIQGSIYNVLTDIRNAMLGSQGMQFAGAGVGGITIENINVTSTGVNAAEIVGDITAEMLRKLGEVQSYNRKRGG